MLTFPPGASWDYLRQAASAGPAAGGRLAALVVLELSTVTRVDLRVARWSTGVTAARNSPWTVRARPSRSASSSRVTHRAKAVRRIPVPTSPTKRAVSSNTPRSRSKQRAPRGCPLGESALIQRALASLDACCCSPRLFGRALSCGPAGRGRSRLEERRAAELSLTTMTASRRQRSEGATRSRRIGSAASFTALDGARGKLTDEGEVPPVA